MAIAEVEGQKFWSPAGAERAPSLFIPDETELIQVGYGVDSTVYRTQACDTVWKVYHNKKLTYDILQMYEKLTNKARLHVAHLPFIKLSGGEMVSVADIVPFNLGYDDRINRFVAQQAFIPGPNVLQMAYISLGGSIASEDYPGMEEQELLQLLELGKDGRIHVSLSQLVGDVSETLGNRIAWYPKIAGLNVKVRTVNERRISFYITDLMSSIKRLQE